jgi:SNF2 family DNA or RNA helicase
MVSKPLADGDPTVFLTLQKLLSSVLIRRTRDSKINGESILKLPKKICTTKYLEFTKAERGKLTLTSYLRCMVAKIQGKG